MADPLFLRVFLITAAVRLVNLSLALLTEEHGETLAQSLASAGETPTSNRFVEKFCIPVWDANWDLNCHTPRVRRFATARKVSAQDRAPSGGVAGINANMSS